MYILGANKYIFRW